jgi:hypothetical protein
LIEVALEDPWQELNKDAAPALRTTMVALASVEKPIIEN